MSGLLLDTHTFLWATSTPSLLSNTARTVLAGLDTDVYLSIATIWEIGIKVSNGRLTLDRPLQETVIEESAINNYILLPIEVQHVSQMMLLPFHRRDPFDRLLVAQSLAENLPLVSVDKVLDAYGIQRIW